MSPLATARAEECGPTPPCTKSNARPRHGRLFRHPGTAATEDALAGSVKRMEFLGASVRFHVECGNAELVANLTGVSQVTESTLPREGDAVYVSFGVADCTVLHDQDTGGVTGTRSDRPTGRGESIDPVGRPLISGSSSPRLSVGAATPQLHRRRG